MPTDPTIVEWMQDPNWESMDYPEKESVLSNYFDDKIANDAFFDLPNEEQQKIRNNFRLSHIGENPEFVESFAQPEPRPDLTFGRLGHQFVARFGKGISHLMRGEEVLHGRREKVPESEYPKRTPSFDEGAFLKGLTNRPDLRKRLKDDPYYKKRQKAVEDLKSLPKYFPEPLEGSSGIIEEGITGVAEFGPAMGLQAVNPVVGAGAIFETIVGSKHEEYTDQGIENERATTLAVVTAALQTPIEFAGNLLQFKFLGKIAEKFTGKPGGKIAAFVLEFLKIGATEGAEEFLQTPPEEIVNIVAANPDIPAKKLVKEAWGKKGDILWQSARGFGAGAIGGMALAGAGGVVMTPAALINYKTEEQKKIDKAREVERQGGEDLLADKEIKDILEKVAPTERMGLRPRPELPGGLRRAPQRTTETTEVPEEMLEDYYDTQAQERLVRDQREKEPSGETLEGRGAIPEQESRSETSESVGEAQEEDVRVSNLRKKSVSGLKRQLARLVTLRNRLEEIPDRPEFGERASEDIPRVEEAISKINGVISEKEGEQAKIGLKVPEREGLITQKIEEAAKEVDTKPTEAQKKAGNYKKGHVQVQGFDISIENPRGSFREGTDKQGKKWRQQMAHHYGYFKRTEGKDSDQIDVFIGEDPQSDKIFVVDQVDPSTGEFDEHKVMIGFRNKISARAGYRDNYEKGWKGFGDITEVSKQFLKGWLSEGRQSKPLSGGIEFKKPKEAAEKYKPLVKYFAERGHDLQPRVPEATAEHENIISIGKALNLTVSFFELDKIGTTNITGYHREKTGEIFINANSKKPFMKVLGHESLHRLSKSRPDLYKKFLSQIPDLKSVDFDTYIDKLTQDRKDIGVEITRDQAIEEFFADFAGEQFANKAFWKELYDKDAGLAKKIADIVSEILEKIKAVLKKGDPLQTQISDLGKTLADVYSEFIGEQDVARETTKKGPGKKYFDNIIKKLKFDLKNKGSGWIRHPEKVSKRIDYKILEHEATGGFYFQKTEDGIRYKKGGAGPNIWSRGEAISKAVKEAESDLRTMIAEAPKPLTEKKKVVTKGKEPKEVKDAKISEPSAVGEVEPGTGVHRGTKPRSDVERPPVVAPGQPPKVEPKLVPPRPRPAEETPSEVSAEGEPVRKPARGKKRVSGRPDQGTGVREDTGAERAAEREPAVEQPPAVEDTELERQPEPEGQQRPELAPEDQNHVIAEDDVIFPRGDETKIRSNIAAIQLVKTLESEDRNPSPDEKKILAKYVGWGQFAQKIFDRGYDQYLSGSYPDTKPEDYFYGDNLKKYKTWESKYGKKLHPKLGGAMTESEWKSAAESTLNAHYTSRPIINKMWDMVKHFGFKGGTVLEPSAGVGHFFGLMPSEIATKSNLLGVELDTISGQILKRLYPQAHIQISGFEASKGIPDNSVDLVISNFPFGNFSVYDKKHPEYAKWSIHNYFFGRTIDSLRPGGLVTAITSHWTLDATTNGKIRRALADKADFIGGIRLPYTAFKKDAGTEVVTDILVFRKKDNTPGLHNDIRTTTDIEVKGQTVTINEYFAKNPDMVLGKNSTAGSMYGKDEYTVEPTAGDLDEKIGIVIRKLPNDIAGQSLVTTEPEQIIYAKPEEQEGNLLEKNGKFYVVEDGRLKKPTIINSKGKEVEAINNKAKEKRVRGYLEIKDIAKKLIDHMQEVDATDSDIALRREKLNDVYDRFVNRFGPLGQNSNKWISRVDNEFPIVDALENETVRMRQTVYKSGPKKGEKYVKKEVSFTKSAIFEKRTIFPFIEPEVAESLEDAARTSMVYRGRLDIPYIGKLIGQEDNRKVESALIDEGKAYLNPETGMIETPDQYLSGNVKKKLRIAQSQVSDNPVIKSNIKALEAVIPEDLDIQFIDFRLGSSWLPTGLIEDFVNDTMGVKVEVAQARTDETSAWGINVLGNSFNSKNTQTWGTSRVKGHKLVLDALNLKRTQVRDVYYEDGKRRTALNKEDSLVAQAKQKEINDEFIRYAKGHDKWSVELEKQYNEEKNGHILREFAVPDIERFPGASNDIMLRPIQKKAVVRALQESTLLAYGVGTGKTYTYITIAMEMRRLKTARKPLIVVQNSTIKQYSSSFKQLYPQSKVLIPDDIQRSAKNRKKLLSQIATGDWDAIVLPHSFFDSIADNVDRQSALIGEQIDEMEASIAEIEATEGKKSMTVKQMKALLKRKKVMLQRLMDRRVDDALTFEQMGIDALLIDEAHAYKRSEFFTKMGTVKGIDQGSSQRSMSLIFKSEYIREKTGGKNVILATGTPISNTTAELWTMMRYIRPEILEEYGVNLFDDFAANFGDTTIQLEETETGEFKVVERFNKYINGPELLTMFHTVADVVLTDDAKLNLPELKDGKPTSVVIEKNDDLNDYINILRAERQRWENLTGREKMRQRHVPLLIYNRAKKAAIDLRLVDPDFYEDDPKSKINTVVNKAYDIWKKSAENKSTQVIFLDMYRHPSGGFNAYEDMRKKLVSKGVPEKEILVITDYKNDTQREAAFQRMRDGKSRIIIGSTGKLGIGVNMQDKMIAAHNVDAPPRPMDLEQRQGRIRREKNENTEIDIFNYGVKNTLDSVLYDRLTKKQRFIDQMLTGDIDGRSFDEPLGDEQISFAEMQAAFSGNKLLFEKSDVEIKIKNLKILEEAYKKRISRSKRDIKTYQNIEIPDAEKELKQAKNRSEYIKKQFPDDKVETISFNNQKMDGKEFIKALDAEFTKFKDWAVKQFNGMAIGEFDKIQGRGETSRSVAAKFGALDAVFEFSPAVYRQYNVKDLAEQPSKKLKVDDSKENFQVRIKVHKGDQIFHRTFVDTVKGILTRFNNKIKTIHQEPDAIKGKINRYKQEIVELEKVSKESFANADELTEAQNRLKDINKELEGQTSETEPDVSEEAAERFDKSFGENGDRVKEAMADPPQYYIHATSGEFKPVEGAEPIDILIDGEKVADFFIHHNKADNLWVITEATLGNAVASSNVKGHAIEMAENRLQSVGKEGFLKKISEAIEEYGESPWMDKKDKIDFSLESSGNEGEPDKIRKFVRKPDPLPSEYEDQKDSWFSNKDWAIQVNSVEAANIQDRIKQALGVRSFNKQAQEIDQAIHIYLDVQRNPQHLVQFYDELSPEQKKIVKLTKKVAENPQLKAIADYIADQYEQTGFEAKSENVIFNTIDNYVARAWKVPEGKFGTDALQNFKTNSRHARQRVFETILEGQALGYELQIKGASNNLENLKNEIARVIEDKRLLRELQKIKGPDGENLVTEKHLAGYREIEHPNFTDWRVVGNVKKGEIKEYRAQNFRVDSKFAVMRAGRKRAMKLFDDLAMARIFVQDLVLAGEIGASELSIEDRHTLWQRQRLYAPRKMAKDLNKVIGVSRLKGLKSIDVLTKYNAVLKSWILVTSFFHHQAFIRSYWFGTRKKTWSEWNINQARKTGLEAIKTFNPEIELLVRNGLTLGKMQDWEESVLRYEQTIFGAALDKAGPLKWVKDKINELRERQADFLFRNLGMGLKAKAALIEYRNALEEHPEMEPNDRAKMVANLINDDFGGLHLKRMGRNPTYQHIMRLGLLAPDWTESNVRTMYKMVFAGGKAEKALYRRFWASVLTKGLSWTIMANLILSLFDDEDFFERYRIAWREGGLRWLGVDITPIYRGIYGEKATAARKYFSIIGHFKDVFKFISDPVKSLHHKGSVLYRYFHEAMAGVDWRGFGFTTTEEFFGLDDKGYYTQIREGGEIKFGKPKGGKLKGKLVSPQSPGGPIDIKTQSLSYILAQARQSNPVQTQQLIGWLQGEIEGFDAISRSLGLYVQSTYPTEKKLTEFYIDEIIRYKQSKKPLTDLHQKVKAHNVREKNREDGITLSWLKMVQKANKRMAAEKFNQKFWQRRAVNE